MRGQSTRLRSDGLVKKLGFTSLVRRSHILLKYHRGMQTPLEVSALPALLHTQGRSRIFMSCIVLCCQHLMPQRTKTGDVWEGNIPSFQNEVKTCGDKTCALKDETSAIDGPRVGVPPCGDGNFTLWVSLSARLHPRRRQRCDNHRKTPSIRSADIRVT